MHVLIVVCPVPHVEALKLIIYSGSQSVLFDQRAIAYPLFLNSNIDVMHWSYAKSYNEPCMLIMFP